MPALVAPVAVCGIPGHTDSGVRLAAEVALLAVVVGVIGFESTLWVGLIAVVASLLSLNGFVEDWYGHLGWHPTVDLRAAAVLAAALALGCGARRGVDRARPGSMEIGGHAVPWGAPGTRPCARPEESDTEVPIDDLA